VKDHTICFGLLKKQVNSKTPVYSQSFALAKVLTDSFNTTNPTFILCPISATGRPQRKIYG